MVRIPLRPRPDPDSLDPQVAPLVELSLSAADAFSRGDIDALLSHYTPDVEIVTGRRDDGGLWASDFNPSYRGHEGLREMAQEWLGAWGSLRLEPEELIWEDDDTYVFFATWFGTGAGSGVEVTTTYQARTTLRDGRIARVEFWADPEQARRDLGLNKP